MKLSSADPVLKPRIRTALALLLPSVSLSMKCRWGSIPHSQLIALSFELRGSVVSASHRQCWFIDALSVAFTRELSISSRSHRYRVASRPRPFTIKIDRCVHVGWIVHLSYCSCADKTRLKRSGIICIVARPRTRWVRSSFVKSAEPLIREINHFGSIIFA